MLTQVREIIVIIFLGEETPEQVATRGDRLRLNTQNIFLLCDVNVENAIESILGMSQLPSLVVVDSVQTMYSQSCNSAIGSISQIRESAAKFLQFAKSTGCSVILVGHVSDITNYLLDFLDTNYFLNDFNLHSR